ncbi:ferredoxin [Intestinimonas sp. HCP28S3_D6]|uniref:ferredoxin n=1 Tax=Intestinimonas sp. HCP28S3_D6 TaxID=3438942 RepID=UPI003F8A7C4F
MKAFVDQDTCIGCGLCCGMCDAVFRMNDGGKAEAYQAAAEENQSDVQSAIDSCPVSAIRWED